MIQQKIQDLLIADLDAVHQQAIYLCSHPQEAEDLVQETYLRALGSIDKFRLSDHGTRPWLMKILYNLFCSRYELQKRERHLLQKRYRDCRPLHGAGGSDADFSYVRWDDIDERLKRALDTLTPIARKTLLLFAFDGLQYREIAARTGAPIGTVMVRLFRGRANVAAQLGNVAIAERWTNGESPKSQRTRLSRRQAAAKLI